MVSSAINNFSVISTNTESDILDNATAKNLNGILTQLETIFNKDKLAEINTIVANHLTDTQTNPHHVTVFYNFYGNILNMLYVQYRKTISDPVSYEKFVNAIFTYINKVMTSEELYDNNNKDKALILTLFERLLNDHNSDTSAHSTLLTPFQYNLIMPNPCFYIDYHLEFGRLFPETFGGQSYFKEVDQTTTINYYFNEIYQQTKDEISVPQISTLNNIGRPALYPVYQKFNGIIDIPTKNGMICFTGRLSNITPTPYEIPIFEFSNNDKTFNLRVYQPINTTNNITIEIIENGITSVLPMVFISSDYFVFLSYTDDRIILQWPRGADLAQQIATINNNIFDITDLQIGVTMTNSTQDLSKTTLDYISIYPNILSADIISLILNTKITH